MRSFLDSGLQFQVHFERSSQFRNLKFMAASRHSCADPLLKTSPKGAKDPEAHGIFSRVFYFLPRTFHFHHRLVRLAVVCTALALPDKCSTASSWPSNSCQDVNIAVLRSSSSRRSYATMKYYGWGIKREIKSG